MVTEIGLKHFQFLCFAFNPGPREPEGATALARDHPTPMDGLRLSRPPAHAGALGIAEGTEGQGQLHDTCFFKPTHHHTMCHHSYNHTTC